MVCDMLCGAVAEVCDNVEEVEVHACGSAAGQVCDNVADSDADDNDVAHSGAVAAELLLLRLPHWFLPRQKRANRPTSTPEKQKTVFS